MLVSDIMTTALITGRPEDLVDQAMYEMKLSAIRHLPVVEGKSRLVGIVSDRDVLLSLGTSQDKTVHLKDIMSQTPQTVSEDCDAIEAIAIMLELKIGCLPVLGSSGQLIGVVTDTDFLRVAYDLLLAD